ncbi:MAG TPA: BREX system ATP-binding domain-containing protein, partial [Polyangiaceae bacterium]|nr:BREX system ATP-binding domain-containing protein [Polyangiaceae bacterium]
MRQQGSLVRFLPSRLVARLTETDTSESWFEGAAVFADIVGFTALTERYAHSGEGGLEKLGGLLNASFARYVEEVHRSGGEVVDFAGDALLAYWPAGPDQTGPDRTGPDQMGPDQIGPDQTQPDQLRAAAAAAAGCAARLAALPSNAILGEAPELHVGLGVGKLWAARVGSADHGLHVVLGGPAVREAVAAEKLSAQGEVMLGAVAAKVLSHLALIARGEFASLQAQATESPLTHAPVKAVPPEAWPMGLIPRVVQERWTGGHGRWVSELRRVTPLFVRVEGVDDTRADALATLQRVSVAIADVIASFSLESGRFLLDDRGLVFMLVFGIPYDTYADDHPRALRAALAIERKLGALGHSCSMGVASGAAFCGVLGTEDRSGYWTIGPPMNRAARLMSAAQRELFCEASLEDIKEHSDLVATEVAPLSLKGLTQLRAVRVMQREASDSTRASLVGRAQEQLTVDRLLSELRDGKGAVLTVVGEAGLGKTALINDLIEKARRRGLVSTIARADPEMTRTYGAWREVLRSYLDVPRELPASELPAWLADPRHRAAQFEHVPLLASLLGVDVDPLPDIHHGAARADAALEALT